MSGLQQRLDILLFTVLSKIYSSPYRGYSKSRQYFPTNAWYYHPKDRSMNRPKRAILKISKNLKPNIICKDNFQKYFSHI